ncbi:hypothetical protein PV328_007285 [Microctonus aethiopoides]|uniref:Uncharacterized protein n=1 Tax=Microctonus aethiopoides TaxID=144406 RepID=A0AA39KUK0_9HYME|nr:hypothetical protein PV328_007285 [Microctonus aethiopoides]
MDLRNILPPKNLTGSHQDDFISLTINREKWRPIMPTVTPFISPYTASTATLAITSLSDNDTSRLNLHSSVIHEDSIAGSGIIDDQNHQSINDEGRFTNYDENFIHSYAFNTRNDSAHYFYDVAGTRDNNHSLNINPSIVLSEDRAFYPGPGTPMPNLFQNNYSHQLPADPIKSMQVTDIIPTRKKRSRGKKNGGPKIDNKQSIIEQSKELTLNIRKKNKNKNKNKSVEVSLSGLSKQENINITGCKKKKKDARLWLNAKSKLSPKIKNNIPAAESSSASSTVTSETKDIFSRLSCRFIDRATSPINFSEDKKIIKSNNKTRDIALSPIRFIEPQLKYSRCYSDEETKMKLSSLSQTIESANKTKTLKRLFDSQYNCEKCIAMSRQMPQPICPTCCTK